MAGDRENRWAQAVLQVEEQKSIEAAVSEAEKLTDGEIVPMLVKSSTNVGGVRLTLALIIFVLFVLVEHEFEVFFAQDYYNFVMPLFLVIFYFLAAPLAKMQFFQRWLTTRGDQISDVNLRAEVEFYRGRYHQTQKKSAILLFVSLMEKRAVVLADENVAKQIDAGVWQEVIGDLTAHIRQQQFAEGMKRAIHKSGQILAKYYPKTTAVKNEVSNHFVIKI